MMKNMFDIDFNTKKDEIALRRAIEGDEEMMQALCEDMLDGVCFDCKKYGWKNLQAILYDTENHKAWLKTVPLLKNLVNMSNHSQVIERIVQQSIAEGDVYGLQELLKHSEPYSAFAGLRIEHARQIGDHFDSHYPEEGLVMLMDCVMRDDMRRINDVKRLYEDASKSINSDFIDERMHWLNKCIPVIAVRAQEKDTMEWVNRVKNQAKSGLKWASSIGDLMSNDLSALKKVDIESLVSHLGESELEEFWHEMRYSVQSLQRSSIQNALHDSKNVNESVNSLNELINKYKQLKDGVSMPSLSLSKAMVEVIIRSVKNNVKVGADSLVVLKKCFAWIDEVDFNMTMKNINMVGIGKEHENEIQKLALTIVSGDGIGLTKKIAERAL